MYLSKRTIVPIKLPNPRKTIPAETVTGAAMPTINVITLSCLGVLAGVNVASIRPSAT